MSNLEIQYERQLEDSLHYYLDGPFVADPITPYRGHDRIVANTARGGRQSGKWSMPDLTLVAIQKLGFQDRIDLELFSFELKRETTANIDSVYEAVAHTRYAHYAYVAWHLPADSMYRTTVLNEVLSCCQDNQIGLILFQDPQQHSTFETALAPVRQSPHPFDLECYLNDRLDSADNQNLREKIQRLVDQ